MDAKAELLEVFKILGKSHHECGERYIDHDLDKFVSSLADQSFYKMKCDEQISILKWYDEAFLGRGSRLVGLINRGLLSDSFGARMEKAILAYFLTIDLPNQVREAMRKRLGILH